jgi:hypothetical protein
MTEKKESQLKFVIKKHEGFKNHTCLPELGKRDIDFNSGKEVEVSKEEFERLTQHRWVIGVSNGG